MAESTFHTAAELAALRHNAKVLGELLGALYRLQLLPPDAGPADAGFVAACRVPRAADFQAAWLLQACRELCIEPRLHRQVWEYAFLLSACRRLGLLQPGRRALGVGTHDDPLTSCLTAHGLEVVLLAEDSAPAQVMERAFRPALVGRARFDALASVEPPNLLSEPFRLAGQFDLCWTTQALERQGSVTAGLGMAHAMIHTLRPGGVALLTTEFDLGLTGTHARGSSAITVFGRTELERLREELAAAGHAMAPLDVAWGTGVLDSYIDMPPYAGDPQAQPGRAEPPHLKLLIEGTVATRIGLVLHAAGASAGGPAHEEEETAT